MRQDGAGGFSYESWGVRSLFEGYETLIHRGSAALLIPATDTYNVFLFAADLVDAALDTLTPVERRVIDIHFFDGKTVFAVARKIGMRKREAEGVLESAVSKLHAYMLRRGVHSIGDFL
jgi:hypothetical protein